MANSFANDGSGTGYNSTDAMTSGFGNSGTANGSGSTNASPEGFGDGFNDSFEQVAGGVEPVTALSGGNPTYSAMFDGGGSTDPDDMQGNPNATDGSGDLLADALTSVDAALQFGRGKYGLPNDSEASDGSGSEGNDQVAGNMPAQPASGPAPSGFAPLAPTATPFGKRVSPGNFNQPSQSSDASDGSMQVAGNIPAAPANGPAPSGFSPLAPTQNPFGKRVAPGTYQPTNNQSDDTAQMDEDA